MINPDLAGGAARKKRFPLRQGQLIASIQGAQKWILLFNSVASFYHFRINNNNNNNKWTTTNGQQLQSPAQEPMSKQAEWK